MSFGLGNATDIPHFRVEIQVLVKMALINKEPVNAELFKVDYRVLALGIVELVELCFYPFSGFHKLLDRELFSFACLYIVNPTLNVIKLPFELFPLPFNAHRDFFKLRMSYNNRIVVACCNTGTELFAVSRFKILLSCHKDISTRIQTQILRSPLTDKMIWNNEHRFIAKSEPLAFLCGGYHFKGFSRTYLVGKERIAAIENMSDSVYLVRS